MSSSHEPDLSTTASELLKASPFARSQVTLERARSALTRFGANHITQNVERDSVSARLLAVEGRRAARVDCDRLDPASVRSAYDRLGRMLAALPESREESVSLARPAASLAKPGAAVRTPTPEDAADCAERAGRAAAEAGFEASGAHGFSRSQVAIASTEGAKLAFETGNSEFACTIEGKGGAGRGFSCERDSARLETDAAIARALAKCRGSLDAVSLEPGEYTVVLEPDAVAELVFNFGHVALSAKSYLEDRSFCRGKLGERILDERITLVDDPLDERVGGSFFDWEGTPRHRVELVSRGVLRELASDRATARKLGRESTGNANEPPSASDPMPWNLCLEWGGDTAPQDELISRVKRGVLVTQLHYVNPMDPMVPSFTGMTRNGTFLIENGRVTRAIRNMRFTQSGVAILNGARAASVERVRAQAWWGIAGLFPALLADGFHFTSATGF
jgi:predicted Zn-dependent protease